MNPFGLPLWIKALVAAALFAAAAWAVSAYNESLREDGREEVRAEYAAKATKADAQRDAIAAPIAAKQEVAQVQIRTITKTILKEVPVYVQVDACPLPGGFRVLHDAAADGQVPDPAGIADAASPAAAEVAATLSDNYGTYHEVAARLRGLQEWVRAQQQVK